MPLRAIIDKKSIHAYNLSLIEWTQLKEERKKLKLTMPCCDNKAIPKTSNLGTQFFAHSRRGECTSKAESKEHLLAKTIIAKACQDEGWRVITEYQGETPNKEKWIADVYAKKNKVEIVFEVQWSSQTEEITRKRQKRYKESGIRSAWFVKKKKRDYYDLIEDYELPYFSIQYQEEKNNFIIPRYNVSLQEFIKGMLNKELSWFPKKNMEVESGLIIIADNCWKCNKPINVVAGLCVSNKEQTFNQFYHMNEVAKTIQNMLTPQLQKYYKIGTIKQRYSKTMQHQYLSNGCYHCDAIYGDFFLKEELLELLVVDTKLDPIKTEIHKLGKEIPLPQQKWYFQGKVSSKEN